MSYVTCFINCISLPLHQKLGKARRLKQAKDEATEEIEKYRTERDRQFKEFESKVIFCLFSHCTHVINVTKHLRASFFPSVTPHSIWAPAKV